MKQWWLLYGARLGGAVCRPTRSRGIYCILFGDRVSAGIADVFSGLAANRLLVSTSSFLSWFTSSFSVFWIWPQISRILKSGVPSTRWIAFLGSQAGYELHLPLLPLPLLPWDVTGPSCSRQSKTHYTEVRLHFLPQTMTAFGTYNVRIKTLYNLHVLEAQTLTAF